MRQIHRFLPSQFGHPNGPRIWHFHFRQVSTALRGWLSPPSQQEIRALFIHGRMADVMDSGRTGRHRHAFLILLCLGALLTSIIGMHLWMGGHAESMTAQSAATMASPAEAKTAGTSILPGLTTEHHPTGGGSPMSGCIGSCDAGDMAAGICVLSLIILAMFVFLIPPRYELPHSLLRRGPPRVTWNSRPVPTPSLTQLCISRT